MPKVALNDRFLRSLTPTSRSQVDFWDARVPDFGVRLSPKGTKTFVVRYVANGRRRRVSIQRYRGPGDLAKARQKAIEILCKVDLGDDPAGPSPEQLTFGQVVDQYLERHAIPSLSPSTVRQYRDRINYHLLPVWGDRPVASIQRSEIRRLAERIRDSGAPVQANRIQKLMSAILGWALDGELVEHNPAARMKAVYKETPRNRVLSPDEIRILWKAWRDSGCVCSLGLRLLLLTGCRRSEVFTLRWDQTSQERWSISKEVTKNRTGQTVFPSRQALLLIEDLRPKTDYSPYLFPLSTIPDRPWTGAAAHVRWRKQTGLLGWTSHDLRRTSATILASLKTPPHIIELVLNHTPVTVAGRHYNKYRYEPELRQAWQDLGDYIEDLVGEIV